MNRPFLALQLVLEAIRLLRPHLKVLARKDRNLEAQLRKSLASTCQNLSEGWRRVGRDRVHSLRIGLAEAAESLTSLDVAVAFGHLEEASLAKPYQKIDSAIAITWTLTR